METPCARRELGGSITTKLKCNSSAELQLEVALMVVDQNCAFFESGGSQKCGAFDYG